MSQPIPITLRDLELAMGKIYVCYTADPAAPMPWDDIITKTWDLLVMNYEKAQLATRPSASDERVGDFEYLLRRLAKEFNQAIVEQEGYNPVGEEWILREFIAAIQIALTHQDRSGLQSMAPAVAKVDRLMARFKSETP